MEGNGHPIWSNLFRKRKGWQALAVEYFAATPMFRDIPANVLRRLVGGMYHRMYAKSEEIFKAGDPGLGMYMILKGGVEIKLGDKVLASLMPGDFFGELALFGEDLRTADAISCDNTELVGFFRPDLEEWVERSPKLGVKVLMQLGYVVARRLYASNAQIYGRDAP